MNKIRRKLYDYYCHNSTERLQTTLDNEFSNERVDIIFDDGKLLS